MKDDLRDKGRKAFSAKQNKELITFFLFVLFAVLMWFVNNAQLVIETDLKVPVSYDTLPQDVVISNKLPDSLNVWVRDDGYVLYGYIFSKVFHPGSLNVSINLMEWKHPGGVAHIPSIHLKGKVSDLMEPTTEILRISPDTITVCYVEKDSKEVPVKLNSDIHLSRQYMLVDEPELNPASVVIYASKDLLDKIDMVETELITVEDHRDSATLNVPLKVIDGVQFSQDDIEVVLRAEPFTETSVSIPVTGANMPEGCQLHTFPSSVNVTFLIRESEYGAVNAKDFKAQVDFNETGSDNDNILQQVILTQCPTYAVRPQISPDKVESLIEKKK